MDTKSGDRDEKGRFLPGHAVKSVGGGRPRADDVEKVRTALSKAIDNGTLTKWAAAMKAKLEKGDQFASEFVFDRIIGKPRQAIDVDADDALREFMTWMIGSDPSDNERGIGSDTDPAASS